METLVAEKPIIKLGKNREFYIGDILCGAPIKEEPSWGKVIYGSYNYVCNVEEYISSRHIVRGEFFEQVKPSKAQTFIMPKTIKKGDIIEVVEKSRISNSYNYVQRTYIVITSNNRNKIEYLEFDTAFKAHKESLIYKH